MADPDARESRTHKNVYFSAQKNLHNINYALAYFKSKYLVMYLLFYEDSTRFSMLN